MRRTIAALVAALAMLVAFAPWASAQSVTICHSVKVTVNGEAVVDDSGCQTLPQE